MSTTVDGGFRELLTRLTPSNSESAAAIRHRESVKACLESEFGMTAFFRTGSFGNGTSISGYSDVDYFAVIPADRLSNISSSSLSAVRDALDRRFPRTGVRVSCPAVRVPFGVDGCESTEVVPAYLLSRSSSGYGVFGIADCSGGWMRSSPEAHRAYVRDIDESLANKVRPLVRFMKAWKYYQDVPVSSFYLELCTAQYASTQSSIVYALDVKCMFATLHRTRLADTQDPQGISGSIRACSTEVKLRDAMSKVETALDRAQRAVEADATGRTDDAFDWWGLLYNHKFPGYHR